MESIFALWPLYFLTDIGLFLGTLWHVHAMVFDMDSIFAMFFHFYQMILNISRATVRAGGGRVGGTGGRAVN